MGSLFGGGNSSAPQQSAADESSKIQKYIFDTQRSDMMPWLNAGKGALEGMQDNDFQRDFTMADFQADPGYQFRMDEAMKALERSASAKGRLGSGATMKALMRTSQGMASDEYNNAYNRFNADRDRRFNRLASVAGAGQTSGSQLGQAGQNYANAVSDNLFDAANARTAAAGANANARANAANTIITGAALFSDERLKTKIERLDKSIYKNVPTYRFEYKDEKHGVGMHIGVMAQDLLKLNPRHPAVIKDKLTGYYKVNYSMLEVR